MSGASQAVRTARLAELVAGLTGEDRADSVEVTAALMHGRPSHGEALEIVARAIVDLRESSRSLRVTRYLDRSFEPVIDLRDRNADDETGDDEIEPRFRRHVRASGSRPLRHGDRPAGTTGFAPR